MLFWVNTKIFASKATKVLMIVETLRKYPPITFTGRVCTEACEFPSSNPSDKDTKVVVDKGTIVVIPILAIHHDPTYYKDPEKFDPDRFSEERKSRLQKNCYFAFGAGPRICLGKS